MTTTEALEFLANHQPMPPDGLLTEELIGTYDDVRQHFMLDNDSRCVPLFLQSFGEGDGFGVYQLVDNVIARYSAYVVVPELISGLRSVHLGVRYWCAQIAALFPDETLIPELARAIADPEIDLRVAAATALEQIKGDNVDAILRNALILEVEEDVREHIRVVLGLVA